MHSLAERRRGDTGGGHDTQAGRRPGPSHGHQTSHVVLPEVPAGGDETPITFRLQDIFFNLINEVV